MGKARAARGARRPSGWSAQAPVSPQWQGWPVPQPQPQPQPDGLADAAWQPQVQVAPAQSEQRQAKVSVVFMVVFSSGLERIRMRAPWRHCRQRPYRALEPKG
jgi:hypothetical protein